MSPIAIKGRYEDPVKSAWSFEEYDSRLEKRMMKRLDRDADVEAWTKRHGIVIAWHPQPGVSRRYIPDFLVRRRDGALHLIEVKNPDWIETAEVRLKGDAARRWCAARGMTYRIVTVEKGS